MKMKEKINNNLSKGCKSELKNRCIEPYFYNLKLNLNLLFKNAKKAGLLLQFYFIEK